MPQNIDVDLYAREQSNGDLIEYVDTEATNNALQLWLSSKRGEFLRNPGEGGPLDSFKFKLLRDEEINLLKFNLINAINNYFSPSVTVVNIDIIPMLTERAVEIKLTYQIKSSATTAITSVFINSEYSYKNFTYEVVEYIEENLLEFVRIKKPDLNATLLLYDEEGFWKWGRFKLINLTSSDPYFDDIFYICNGG